MKRSVCFLTMAFLTSATFGDGEAGGGFEPEDQKHQARLKQSYGGYFDSWTPGQRELAVNLGIVAGVSLYGFTQWGWGESDFRFENEGWLGKNTKSGGADKLGHAYTGAVVTALTTSLYRHWGHDEQRSVNMGAVAGLLATTMIEVGDGFSEEHGFSWEDQVFNLAGVGLEYLRQRYPELRERVQFRWEYFPSSDFRHGGNTDILTDYEGSRWMLAFPLQAWLNDDAGWLGWFDVLVGYGTRGYSGRDDPKRHPFIGIGLSFPKAKQHFHIGGPARVLEYLQIPGTAYPLPP